MSDKPYSWGNIDQAERPEEFATYLDTVTALGEMQRYKQKTYQLFRMGVGSHFWTWAAVWGMMCVPSPTWWAQVDVWWALTIATR
jgi:hypothetical protein